MATDDRGVFPELSRRRLLAAAGLGSGALLAGTTQRAMEASAAPLPADVAGAPSLAGLHLQFGSDAATEVTVSWHTLAPVERPRVVLGRPDGTLETTVDAGQASYVDAKSGQIVRAYHARLHPLRPDTSYMYGAVHEGATPEWGSFRTAPRGRAAFTFTSFADQGTPTLGKRFVPPPGVTLKFPLFVTDNLGSPAAGDTTLGVERIRPLFHLFNGDLSYANLSDDRVRSWWDFWDNNARSARNRPWMPCPGNHENERGNGPIGFSAYQTYVRVPEAPGQTEVTRGLWYAFTAGSVRVISLANDDVAYQDAGNTYVRGYSSGAQHAWLEQELAATRANRDIDWVVVCMHQTVVSTAQANGADLGVREAWLPLFDRYGVDLVVCGHEHHYERSHPIRGRMANRTLTPIPVAFATDVIDTSQGTVHMVIGGGGTSVPTNGLFFNPPQCQVVVAAGAPDATGKRAAVYVREEAPWLAVRDTAHAYGFASFTVDPGSRPGGPTTLKVVYYNVAGPGGQLSVFDTFELRRPRRD